MKPKLPTPGTLNKYGLTAEAFKTILAHQGGTCAVCGKVPNGHWVIDHEHRKGWKNMPPEQRVKYVRGILCWYCNYYHLAKGMTVERARSVIEYLMDYQERITR